MRLWKIVGTYARRSVEFFYRTDTDVVDDWELQEFHAELRGPRGGHIRNLPGGEAGLTTREDLIEIVTRMIYIASAGHASVNNGQYDHYGFVPNLPGYISTAPPNDANEDRSEQDLAAAMPTLADASVQVIMTRLLSRETEMPLGNFPTEFFAGTDAFFPIADAFRKDLHDFAQEIEQRNRTADVPYTYLDPRQVACSITA